MFNIIHSMNIHHRKFWSEEVCIKVHFSSHRLISLFKSHSLCGYSKAQERHNVFLVQKVEKSDFSRSRHHSLFSCAYSYLLFSAEVFGVYNWSDSHSAFLQLPVYTVLCRMHSHESCWKWACAPLLKWHTDAPDSLCLETFSSFSFVKNNNS